MFKFLLGEITSRVLSNKVNYPVLVSLDVTVSFQTDMKFLLILLSLLDLADVTDLPTPIEHLCPLFFPLVVAKSLPQDGKLAD